MAAPGRRVSRFMEDTNEKEFICFKERVEQLLANHNKPLASKVKPLSAVPSRSSLRKISLIKKPNLVTQPKTFLRMNTKNKKDTFVQEKCVDEQAQYGDMSEKSIVSEKNTIFIAKHDLARLVPEELIQMNSTNDINVLYKKSSPDKDRNLSDPLLSRALEQPQKTITWARCNICNGFKPHEKFPKSESKSRLKTSRYRLKKSKRLCPKCTNTKITQTIMQCNIPEDGSGDKSNSSNIEMLALEETSILPAHWYWFAGSVAIFIVYAIIGMIYQYERNCYNSGTNNTVKYYIKCFFEWASRMCGLEEPKTKWDCLWYALWS